MEGELHFFDLTNLSFKFSILTQPTSSPVYSVGSSWVAFLATSATDVYISHSTQEIIPYSDQILSSLSNAVSNVALVSNKAVDKISSYLAAPTSESPSYKGTQGPHLTKSITPLSGSNKDLEGMVTIMNLTTKKIMVAFQAHKSPISHIIFSPDGLKVSLYLFYLFYIAFNNSLSWPTWVPVATWLRK